MYDEWVRALTKRVISLAVGACFGLAAFTGVSAAQNAQDPLGAQSAAPNVGLGLPDQGDVRDNDDSGGNPGSGSAPTAGTDPGQGGSLPSTDSGSAPGSPAGTTASASLPFTGFLAIPVLIAGIALLGTGLAVRRRASA